MATPLPLNAAWICRYAGIWAWRGQGETLFLTGHTDAAVTGATPIVDQGDKDSGAADMKARRAADGVAAERLTQVTSPTCRSAFLTSDDEEASS